MPVDPETGTYSPNAGIYPGGGLSGAASAISNIDAGQIAQQERQKRQLALLLQQLQGEQEQAKTRGQNLQNRQLSTELEGQQQYRNWANDPENESAGFDEMSKQALSSGFVSPQHASTVLWRGAGAESKDFATRVKHSAELRKSGMPFDMSLVGAGLDDGFLRSSGIDPQKYKTTAMAQIEKDAAQAKELEARAGLEDQKRENLAAIGPEQVRDLQSKQILRNAQAAFYKSKALLAGADQSLRGKKMAVEAKRLSAPYMQAATRLRARIAYTPEEADLLEKKAQAIEAEGQKIVQEADGIIGQQGSGMPNPNQTTTTPGGPAQFNYIPGTDSISPIR